MSESRSRSLPVAITLIVLAVALVVAASFFLEDAAYQPVNHTAQFDRQSGQVRYLRGEKKRWTWWPGGDEQLVELAREQWIEELLPSQQAEFREVESSVPKTRILARFHPDGRSITPLEVTAPNADRD
ncbi:MAG: hypothetical protein AAF488_05315 [Planctomycetota bacterium]